MKKKNLFLLAILLLGIGFAVVSTTLYLNGNVKIATNNADFDVKFTKAVLDGTDISSTAISPDGKTITYTTKDLSIVGDISKLDFEITNNSEMYDADVSVELSVNEAYKDYYQITKVVPTPIVGKRTGTGKIEISLIKASIEDVQGTFTCTLTATAKERPSKAEGPQIYYAFGDPATKADRTTDYTTLKYPDTDTPAKVFAKLDADGVQKSVCILYNENIECFKNDNFAMEKENLLELFGTTNCAITSGGNEVTCNGSGLSCKVVNYNFGPVPTCSDTDSRFYCDITSSYVYCNKY